MWNITNYFLLKIDSFLIAFYNFLLSSFVYYKFMHTCFFFFVEKVERQNRITYLHKNFVLQPVWKWKWCDMLQRVRAVILIRIMRSLDRLSGSDQDCGDREMYIDLDDASVDSLTGKRSRHHVVGAEVFHTILFLLLCFFLFINLSRYIIRRFYLIRERE